MNKLIKATEGREPLRQLNLNDRRVRDWYDAVSHHYESGSCKKDSGGNDARCAGCERLKSRRDFLRAVPGLLV